MCGHAIYPQSSYVALAEIGDVIDTRKTTSGNCPAIWTFLAASLEGNTLIL